MARSLHPASYTNNPGFKTLIARTGLPFKPYTTFGPDELRERSELYIRIAEWVWNPSRLDLGGCSPPVHKPIQEYEDADLVEELDRPDRHEARLAFWTALLGHAHQQSELHKHISPNRFHWAGTSQKSLWWNYAVTIGETRVELYLYRATAVENKTIFDQLLLEKEAIEADFGKPLEWQRLDERRASRISFYLPGGWADQSTWEDLVPKAVDAMERLHRALAPRLITNGHL